MIKWTKDFKDYELLSCGNGHKIERFGKYILKRPDPQAIWPMKDEKDYDINAIYHRSNEGGGNWEFINLPNSWQINYSIDNKKIIFNLKPYTFKHTGVFPEQAVNWQFIYETIIKKNKKDFKVLNMFAYTGGATMISSLANAKVVHLDASKGIVSFAKENYLSSRLDENNIRWIVDDARKFVKREERRGNYYDAIILDPPSYGRGTNNEVWKIENDIYNLLVDLTNILNKNSSFVLFNSYTTGLQEGVLNYLLSDTLVKKFGGKIISYELGLKAKNNGLILPEGNTSIWINE